MRTTGQLIQAEEVCLEAKSEESVTQGNKYLFGEQPAKAIISAGAYNKESRIAASETGYAINEIEETTELPKVESYSNSEDEKVYSENEEELLVKESFSIIDRDNKIFNSFVGINRLPSGALKIGSLLGAGAFGSVYSGRWEDRMVALKAVDLKEAVKKLRIPQDTAKEALGWEISRLSSVSHPNLVQFYGIYQHEDQGYTYLVMEFCAGGTLQKALEKKDVPWSKRWKWALEITESLVYLHNEGVLHRDLKAENILLDSNGRAKLADLGVAQVDALLQKDEARVVAQGLQDKRFIAPENVKNGNFSSKATDVYALGWVFWQIATGMEPKRIEELYNYQKEEWIAGERIEREAIPDNCPNSFKKLILNCWQYDPNQRPGAEGVIEILKEMAPGYTDDYMLIKSCQKIESLIHPRRKEALAYIAPFITKAEIKEPIEKYWDNIESSKQNGYGTLNPPLKLEDTFTDFLANPKPSALLLLGEAGLGKTISIYLWADKLMQQWWEYIEDKNKPVPAYFPIFIRPLASKWSHRSINGMFLEAIKQYGLPDIRPLVFVDGYDELQIDEKPINLAKHLGLWEYDNAKLVITCRPKTVAGQELYERFNFKGQLQTRYFLPFRMDQLLEYLRKQLSWTEEVHKNYEKALKDSPTVREVLRNPFILSLLKQAWGTISLEQLSRCKIYESFIQHSIEAQQKLLPRNVIKNLTLSYDNLFHSFKEFASDVAFLACQNRNITLDKTLVTTKISLPWLKLEQLIKEASSTKFRKRHIRLDSQTENAEKAIIQRRSLLSEVDYIAIMQKQLQRFESGLPLKQRKQNYEFIHKSMFEYFAAVKLNQLAFSAIELNMVEELKKLTIEKFDPEILIFLHEYWQESESFKQLFNDEGKYIGNLPKCQALSIAELITSIGRVLYNKSKYVISNDYHFKALLIKQKELELEHLEIADCYDNIGFGLQGQGRHGEALEYLKKALFIRELSFGNAGINKALADSFHNIGGAYVRLLNKEDIEEGIKNLQKALEMRIELYKESHRGKITWKLNEKEYQVVHPEVAWSLNNLGYTYLMRDNIDEIKKGFEYLNGAFHIREELYKTTNNAELARSLNNIGDGYKRLGKFGEYKDMVQYYDKVLDFYQRSLNMKQAIYDEYHPELAKSYNNIGEIQLAKAIKDGISKLSYHESLYNLEKSLQIRKVLHNGIHTDIASSLKATAKAYKQLGDINKCLDYYIQAYSIYQFCNKDGRLNQKIDKAKAHIEDISRILGTTSLSIKEASMRAIIVNHGVINKEWLQIKLQLQDKVLNEISSLAEQGIWEENKQGSKGVKSYLKEETLKGYLEGVYEGDESIKIARILCFEAINLGIMKGFGKISSRYECAQSFLREYGELTSPILDKHPECFVDGSIVESCITVLPQEYVKHIAENMKYVVINK